MYTSGFSLHFVTCFFLWLTRTLLNAERYNQVLLRAHATMLLAFQVLLFGTDAHKGSFPVLSLPFEGRVADSKGE